METAHDLDAPALQRELWRFEIELHNLAHPTKYSFASFDERRGRAKEVGRAIKASIESVSPEMRDELEREIDDAIKTVTLNAQLLGFYVRVSSWGR